jgi:SnoaL-like domain
MALADDLATTVACQALAVDYWYDVDFNWGRTAHEFYTETGVFKTTEHEFKGREAVRAFYGWREGRGDRVARHVINNVRVKPEGRDRAHVSYIMSLFAADGKPVLPSEPAIMVADVTEVCVREADGRWRNEARTIRPIFRSKTPTTSPSKDAVAAMLAGKS